MTQPIVCTSQHQFENALGMLWKTPQQFPVQIEVKRFDPIRTGPQNNRLWLLHNLRAAHINQTWPERAATIVAKMQLAGVPLSALMQRVLLAKVWDKDDMHEEFKKRYLQGKSSAQAGKHSMALAMTQYEADMVNDGVEIPEREDAA